MSIQSFLSVSRLILILTFGFTMAFAQESKPTVSPSDSMEKPDDEVVRIKTDLIRTGVSVFDKKGKFVDDLKPEDFELRIDGKHISISFIEAAARKAANNGQGTASSSEKTNAPELFGRRIIFFVDDVHLAVDSAKRTRKLLKDFVDTQMIPNDLVVIVSTTGRLGALQQFTSDKIALHAAIEKLTYNGEFGGADRSFPPMSEYEALLIDRLDQDTIDRFVEAAVKEKFGGVNASGNAQTNSLIALEKKTAHSNTLARSRRVLMKAASITAGTYGGLEDTANAVAQMPGRKVMLFISDGFIVDLSANASYFLNRITNAAARSNMVIYSLDAKGLEGNAPGGSESASYGSDIGNSAAGAFTTQAGSNLESLDGLNVFARNTGGKLITNINNLRTSVSKVLEEAAIYYLLAWEPESENGNAEKLKRIEVTVKGRPDLKVLTYNGYLNENPKTAKKVDLNAPNSNPAKAAEPTKTVTAPPMSVADEQLGQALRSEVPKTSLQTAVVANYHEPSADGASLVVSLQIRGGDVEFKENADKSEATVAALGIIFNSEGKQEAKFRETIALAAPTASLSEVERPNIYYTYHAKLKPGLYQVRVATRDEKNGNLGSASQWIEIPDMSSKNLALSSILLSERMKYDKVAQVPTFGKPGDTKTTISIDREFSNSSFLRYAFMIYNAAPGSDTKLNLTAELQIFQDKKLVASLPAAQVITDRQDPAKLNYVGEINLESLSDGRYEMKVTVNDLNAKKKVVQTANFEIQ